MTQDTGSPHGRLGQIVEGTPASRDRVVDLVRAVSILVVVLGHWLVASVERQGGELVGENALGPVPGLRPVTWVVQVIALFFLVGGFSNARALGSGGVRVRAVGRFFASRAERLLRPTVAFTAIWLLLAALLTTTSVDPGLVHDAARIAAQPLWFLAVYLLLVLCAPLQMRLHARRPWLLVVVLPLLCVALDALRLNDVLPGAAVANYLVVFLFAQELGFAYADGRFARVRRALALWVAVGAFGVLGLLTFAGPYPVSMVGVPGEELSNMSPPTVCILILTIGQGALLLAIHAPLTRWLARARVWTAVIAVNLVIMTLFLWHLTALVAVGAVAYALDAFPAIGSAAWWWQRPLWIVGELAVLALLVLAFGPLERMRSWVRVARPAVTRRSIGILIAFRGLAGFALTGFQHATRAGGSPLLGTRLSPLVDLVLLVAGWLLAAGWPRLERVAAPAEREAG